MLPRHIVRQFQSPYTPSPRGLSRISARQVALALASRFSRMLSFQIKDMEFTGAAILVYQNNEMAAILVYGTGISSFLFKYFVLFHHPTGATDHVSENDLLV